MLTNEEIKSRIIEAHKIRRWYQKPYYGGIEWPVKTHFEDGKTNASSYGVGRWNNYIKPMIEKIEYDLDVSNSTFCDIGCSAGLFLLLAWEKFNFKRLVGVEAADGGYAQLSLTKDYYDKMPLLTYKNAIGKLTNSIADSKAQQINMNTFPIADLTLMSCVHYHMTEIDLRIYLHDLLQKTMYLMVLTDERAGGVVNASSNYLRGIIDEMNDWRFVDVIKTEPNLLLPHVQPPCKDLTVLLYKSRLLKRLDVDVCFEKQVLHNEYNKNFYTKIFPDFIHGVLDGSINENNYKETEVYKWQNNSYYKSTPWSVKISGDRTLSYINIVKTIKEHGQEQPIGLQEHLNTVDPWDGFHRVAVLKYLGCKYVYGVDVIPDN